VYTISTLTDVLLTFVDALLTIITINKAFINRIYQLYCKVYTIQH